MKSSRTLLIAADDLLREVLDTPDAMPRQWCQTVARHLADAARFEHDFIIRRDAPRAELAEPTAAEEAAR